MALKDEDESEVEFLRQELKISDGRSAETTALLSRSRGDCEAQPQGTARILRVVRALATTGGPRPTSLLC